MPRPSAARPCVRCGHAQSKHTHRAAGQCTVKVPVRRRGSSRRGTARIVYCDCPGYLGTDGQAAPVQTFGGIGSVVRGG